MFRPGSGIDYFTWAMRRFGPQRLVGDEEPRNQARALSRGISVLMMLMGAVMFLSALPGTPF